MQIVFPDPIDLLDADKAALCQLGNITFYDDAPDSDEELIQRIRGSELIVASWVDVTENTINSSPALKYIVVPAVGYDQINVDAATAVGVKVINCPTHNALAVAEYTIGLMLSVSRKLLEANQALCHATWNPHLFLGIELRGKKLGLIGHGTIGKEVENLAKALGMEVVHATSRTTPAELDQLLASVDFLSLHLPLTPSTKHLIDRRRLSLMKRSAYLINTARGAIVDQQALLDALKQNQIAGAALDVFEQEPVTGGPGAEILELAELPNVVATPHIAYNTEEMRVRLGQELIANIQACLSGNPINVINDP